ncbi:Uncharacterized protein DAT39_003155 [Clarias magur]|uniref:Uncharacterized protein n=1 Tax=Clarias magur TaxID=1594786 RepID=A0A8J4X9R9_CLAMG|nr:Uncharacterized protein DAT39_003155 [Clarias magur]
MADGRIRAKTQLTQHSDRTFPGFSETCSLTRTQAHMRGDIQSFNTAASVKLHLVVLALRHIPTEARVTGYSGL